jgi:hypothetical protein
MDANDRELFEERAAIMEFDGGLPREEAERLARLEAEKREVATWPPEIQRQHWEMMKRWRKAA